MAVAAATLRRRPAVVRRSEVTASATVYAGGTLTVHALTLLLTHTAPVPAAYGTAKAQRHGRAMMNESANDNS